MQRNSWEQGVAMDAFFEQGDRDVVIALAKEAANRRIPDGRPAMIRPDEGITDPCSVGEALIFSFRETDDKDLGDACDSLLNWALESAPRNHHGIVYHLPNRPEFWIDSMYMLPPYLAAASYSTGQLVVEYATVRFHSPEDFGPIPLQPVRGKPMTLITLDKAQGCFRSPGARNIIWKISWRIIVPGLENRSGGLPGRFDHVRSMKQTRVPYHAVIE